MKEQMNNLKARLTMSEEQKKVVKAEAKRFAYTVAFGVAAAVAINAGTKFVETQIESFTSPAVVEAPAVEVEA
jgi:hypothetical protein